MGILGAGLQPAGSSHAGLGQVVPSVTPGGALLASDDGSEVYGSRMIDPRSKDYVMAPNGRLLGMKNINQLVQLAVMNAGPKLDEIDRLNDGFENAASAILSAACAPLVAQGLIEVIGVRRTWMSERDGLRQGQAVVRFCWRDVSTGAERFTGF